MGSAALFAAAVVAAVTLSVPTIQAPSEASVLPQIESAKAVEALREVAVGPPTLQKHYLEVEPGVLFAVKGKRERRQVRFARLVKGLTGDRREVYVNEGFPTFRHRENNAGIRTEHWTYLAKRITYVFHEDRLVGILPF
jgi:hypothetical protein